MDEATRKARYVKQNKGGAETPAQRRRRMHKRGHQQRQAVIRILRPPVDLGLPEYMNATFTPYRLTLNGTDLMPYLAKDKT